VSVRGTLLSAGNGTGVRSEPSRRACSGPRPIGRAPGVAAPPVGAHAVPTSTRRHDLALGRRRQHTPERAHGPARAAVSPSALTWPATRATLRRTAPFGPVLTGTTLER